MPFETTEKPKNVRGGSRFILIAAAGIAVIAVGTSMFRGYKDGPPPPAAPASQGEAKPLPLDASIAQLEAKLKANPGDGAGWQGLGVALVNTERFPEAVQAFKRATQIMPTSSDAWSSLGEALTLAGGKSGTFSPDAKAAFETATKLDPNDPRARYFLAVAKDMGGDHRGAIDRWFALLKDSPVGAPWEQAVRDAITNVAAKNKIDVTARLAAMRRAAPIVGGAGAAAAAIPGPTPDQMRAAAQLPPGQQEAMVQGMVDGLAAKLAANPKNADGWIMLMRSRAQLGEHAKAQDAYRSASSAFKDDVNVTARLSEAAKTLGVAAQ
jgi:cytochrome c-type biogenesis protein CcmH